MKLSTYLKHLAMWWICLNVGILLGVVMLPVEVGVIAVARLLGTEDARWSGLGFVLRQFTDVRMLMSLYPLEGEVR